MSRYKTFESTGVATAGRIYAGDLNGIQDHYADLSDFSQTVDLATLRVGSSDLQILKYGAGEIRMTGAVRIDGGFLPGRYTTTQRNSLTNPPTGLTIFNTTTNQIEINLGSPSSPLWSPLTDPPGTILDYAGASLPPGFLWCDGAPYSRTTYAALFAAIGTIWDTFGGLAAPSGTQFRVPDLRALTTAGKADMGGSTPSRATKLGRAAASTLAGLFGEEYHTTSVGEMPVHAHGVNDPGHDHGVYDPGHAHGEGTESAYHYHPLGHPTLTTEPYDVGQYVGNLGTAGGPVYVFYGTGNETPAHVHQIYNAGTNIGIYSHGSNISLQNAGSGSAHENTPPVAIVNKIIKY